jgi:hypothetical protein
VSVIRAARRSHRWQRTLKTPDQYRPVQIRVGGTCLSDRAIGAIDALGKVTCNTALPAEFGTTTNTGSVPTTATSPTSVTSVTLPTGGSYVALTNPTATVTSTAKHVSVSCTLTVGSNTEDPRRHDRLHRNLGRYQQRVEALGGVPGVRL